MHTDEEVVRARVHLMTPGAAHPNDLLQMPGPDEGQHPGGDIHQRLEALHNGDSLCPWLCPCLRYWCCVRTLQNSSLRTSSGSEIRLQSGPNEKTLKNFSPWNRPDPA